MNWLKRKIIKWVREDWEEANQAIACEDGPKLRRGINTLSRQSDHSLDSDATLTFTVYNAIGGKVVEFRRYDRKQDRSDHSVYVIGKDEDFGEKIAKIATLETLRG